MIYLKALLAVIPLIAALFKLFIKSPEEKHKQLVLDIHSAIQMAEQTGNTADIEKIINS
jgi:hypothetical protein